MSIVEESLYQLGVSRDTGERWIATFNQLHRYYHTLDHIQAMLKGYYKLRLNSKPLLAAIWLHDIVYDPTRSDNEIQSAAQARRELRECNFDIDLVEDLILSTQFKGYTGHYGLLHCILHDLDIEIFAADRETYRKYMIAIRKEYSHVPLDVYMVERSKILQMYRTHQIFKTSTYYDKFWKSAGDNLLYEIQLLNGDPKAFLQALT
jgi:predicted metal-dependent HD superfamily phosphohydrolase